MPYDKKDFESHQQKVKDWEVQYAGYCGRCGLPFEHCLHRDPQFKFAQGEAVKVYHAQGSWEAITNVQKNWYAKKLEGMTQEEILKIPFPPKKMFIPILREWKKTLEILQASPPPTLWERLEAQ